jgi:chromosome segregation ATPase
LQESGVFESDNCLEIQSQGTQTEIADFPCLDKTNAELCAEIEKLNKFREEIEECSAKKTGAVVVATTKRETPQTLEQRRLQYYQERLLQIENKLLIYESTGDLQVQRLAERLQRELHLESLIKQLTEKIMLLESVNYNLEDERCELEEIENDTRLRLQRMEIDLEVLNQSNIELEMSRSSYINKFQDAKTSMANLEESLVRAEERIFVLEEHENELKHKLDMITAFMPVILLFNSWKTHEDIKKSLLGSTRLRRQHRKQQPTSTCLTLDTVQLNDVYANPSEVKLHTLMNREKELMQNIAELNRAYNETLENADNLWAQMEKEYKDKISRCEEVESNLKTKITQLEDSLRKDHVYAQERIFALEETEAEQQSRNTKLNRENKELHVKYTTVQEELTALKEEYATLQNYIKGPAMETLEKEKKKVRKLEDELLLSKRMIENLEEVHKDEINMVKSQLMRTNKELTHIEVTNSELREEVDTLETRIRELMAERSRNEEKLQRLSQELQGKQNQVHQMQQIVRVPNKSLAQELGRPVKRNYTVDGSQIHAATRGLSEAIDFFEVSSSIAQRRPDVADRFDNQQENIKAQQSSNSNSIEAKEVTKEVKSLADSIISSAEARGARPIKKSFVEEVSVRSRVVLSLTDFRNSKRPHRCA